MTIYPTTTTRCPFTHDICDEDCHLINEDGECVFGEIAEALWGINRYLKEKSEE